MRTIALALTVAIACGPLGIPASAADFSHAKRTYVPSSAYDRHVDFTTMQDYQAVSSSVPLQARPSTTKFTSTAKKAAAGLPKAKAAVPPPPPSLTAQLKKAVSTPQAQQAIASLKKRAIEYVQSGKFEEAKQVAARVLQLAPQDKTVLKGMAVGSLDKAKQFVQSADFDKALEYGREALAYDGNNVEAKKVVDALLIKSGIDPANVEQRLKSADLLLSQGKNDEAFVEYQSALKLKQNADSHVGIGNIAMRAGQKDRAKNEYHAAIDVEPNSSAGYRQLGLLKLGQGDVVGANAALSRALVLNPNDKNASKSLIDLWQQQVSKVPGANSHLGLARAYQLSGDLPNAQNEYRQVVRMDPENPHLPAARQSFKLALARQEAQRALEAGRTLDAAGATQDAYGKVLEAVKLSPGDTELRVYQGDLLAKLQRYPAAHDAYLNALKINPHNAIAAARLKALPPDAVAIAPELAIPPGQTFGANGVAAASNGTASISAGQVPTADPVSNISNFALALRNQMVTQKSQMESYEDAAHAALKQMTAPVTPSETLATAGIGADGAGAMAAATGAATASTAADGMGSNVTSALSSAAAAIAAAKGMLHPNAAAAAAAKATAAPAAEGAAAAAPAVAAAATPALPKPLATLNNLQEQNQQLQSQLKTMRDSLAKLRGKKAVPAAATAAPESASQTAGSTFAPMATQNNTDLDNILGVKTSSTENVTSNLLPMPPSTVPDEPPLAPPIAQTMAGMQFGNGGNGLRSIAPEIDPSANAYAPPAAPQAIPSIMPNPGAVRLELMNASAKLGGVELNVALRNDSDAPLPLTANKYKAVINYNNRRPANVNVTFGDTIVPPHGTVNGLIKVPFDKVDPTADLVIPDLLPAGAPARDVHLITSMALR